MPRSKPIRGQGGADFGRRGPRGTGTSEGTELAITRTYEIACAARTGAELFEPRAALCASLCARTVFLTEPCAGTREIHSTLTSDRLKYQAMHALVGDQSPRDAEVVESVPVWAGVPELH